jgi:hypothetical protein
VHVASGELATSRNGTPGYKLKFRVLGGDFAGRFLWHDSWLTDAALPRTKRDLTKLGIVTSEQLERPIPPGIRCSVSVTLRTCDDGVERNEVRKFEVLGIDPPDSDVFAPAPVNDGPKPLAAQARVEEEGVKP